MIPAKVFASTVDRVFRNRIYFEDSLIEEEPIVDQVEKWANDNSITLPTGWKVDIARELINNFDRAMRDIPDSLQTQWVSLFETFNRN